MRKLFTCLAYLLPFTLAAQQNVTVTSIVINSNPATSCTNTMITVSGMLSAANYAFVGTPVFVSGNTINVSVEYTSGFIILPAFVPYTHSVSLGMLAPGTYTINVTGVLDNIPQASMTSSVTVISCCNAQPDIWAADTVICPGDSVHLADSGSGATAHAWYRGGQLVGSNLAFSEVLTTPGTYTYKLVVDGTGCQDSITKNIVVAIPPSVNLGPDTTICDGGSFLINPGSQFSSFLWQDGSMNQTFSATAVGTYSVTVSSAQGCSDADTMSITAVLPNSTIDLGNDTTVCPGETITLDAGTWSSYFWTTGNTTQTIVAGPGAYSVSVTTPGVCPGAGSIIIDTFVLPPLTYDPNPTGCGLAEAMLPTGFSNYNWSNGGSTTNTQTFTSGGVFNCTVTDANGCTQEANMTVTVNGVPSVSLGNDTMFCESPNWGPVVLNAPTGLGYTFLWSDGSTGDTLAVDSTNFTALTFWVQVTDSNGCSSTDSVIVEGVVCESVPENGIANLQVYPNPAKGQVWLAAENGSYEVALTDLTGRVVRNQQLNLSTGPTPYPLSGLSQGVYLLQISQGQNRSVVRLLVE